MRVRVRGPPDHRSSFLKDVTDCDIPSLFPNAKISLTSLNEAGSNKEPLMTEEPLDEGTQAGLARRFNTTPQGPFADQRGTQLSDEEHLVAECMEAKGYAKVKK